MTDSAVSDSAASPWLCPICNTRLVRISEAVRDYVCPVAMRGFRLNKLNEKTNHKHAIVYALASTSPEGAD